MVQGSRWTVLESRYLSDLFALSEISAAAVSLPWEPSVAKFNSAQGLLVCSVAAM